MLRTKFFIQREFFADFFTEFPLFFLCPCGELRGLQPSNLLFQDSPGMSHVLRDRADCDIDFFAVHSIRMRFGDRTHTAVSTAGSFMVRWFAVPCPGYPGLFLLPGRSESPLVPFTGGLLYHRRPFRAGRGAPQGLRPFVDSSQRIYFAFFWHGLIF